LRIASVLPLPPGRGPRHLAFHPSGTIAYLVGELEPVLSVLAAEEGTGALRVLREMPLVPAAPGPGRIYPSEVKVHPSARLLAAALRGAEGAFDGFALFRLDASGDPSPAGHVPSGGDFTRHFAFDAAGRFLVAAHQKGNALSAFRVDADAATLTPLGEPVSAPAPSCVLIA
jgi:6-phosphogluconolactonase (cycloisomerase 2 family)